MFCSYHPFFNYYSYFIIIAWQGLDPLSAFLLQDMKLSHELSNASNTTAGIHSSFHCDPAKGQNGRWWMNGWMNGLT